MWPYPWTHVGTPSHLGHMDRVAATMPSQAHAGAAQEAPDMGQWEGQDVPLVRPSSCNVKGGIPSSRRYLPTYLPRMGIKVVKEVARGVAKMDPLTPRGAHQRPLLHTLLLLHQLLPQVTPRSAPKGITLRLKGITLRSGAWPGWPGPSLLQGWMSSSLMRSRGAAPKRRTWFSGSS